MGSKASEGTGVLARREQANKEQKLPFVSLHRLPAEGVVRLKVCLLTSKGWIKSGFTYFKLRKKFLTCVLSIFGFS